ncbi:hypothetical protein [Weissella soli]|uniref:hypothetical protein n=1 Tax=Weissella soli TaxID=155866 RepID=UPI003EF64741
MGKRTVANVDDFFDHEYEMYQALANMQGLIKSPEISDMPRNQPVGNTSFDKMTNIAHASAVVDAVNSVVESIPAKRGRQVMEWRLEGKTWLEIEQISFHSHKWVGDNRAAAYNFFARLFDQSYEGLLEPFTID